jgi:hypothetical protein
MMTTSPLRQNLVQSAVDDAGDFHDRTQFFELTNKTGLWGFATFEATVAVVFKQHNTACFDEDTFDRHREVHPSPRAPRHSQRLILRLCG